jgi:hypothetical protein
MKKWVMAQRLSLSWVSLSHSNRLLALLAWLGLSGKDYLGWKTVILPKIYVWGTAGEMLHVAEPFLERNLHPTVIIRGYVKALEDALSIVDELAFPIDTKDREQMLKIIASCIGTKFTSRFGTLMPVRLFARHVLSFGCCDTRCLFLKCLDHSLSDVSFPPEMLLISFRGNFDPWGAASDWHTGMNGATRIVRIQQHLRNVDVRLAGAGA